MAWVAAWPNRSGFEHTPPSLISGHYSNGYKKSLFHITDPMGNFHLGCVRLLSIIMEDTDSSP